MKQRKCGVLLPIFSLPSAYGIGCFSKEAYEFVDQLERAGQKYWQLLPLGPTGYGDSPYQSFSTFAGNPYFIDLEQLIEKGWLSKEECDEADLGAEEHQVNYEKQYFNRFPLLRKAYEKSRIQKEEAFLKFCEEEKEWLMDYALYMAIKEEIFHGKGYMEWEEEIRLRDKSAMEKYRVQLKDTIEFYCFLQYEFEYQWRKLKKYANEKGIEIIGDIPIYVALDSADVWANQELFQFEEDGTPMKVAGCPPDAFSKEGQLWGNPLYRWEYHKQTKYAWWIQRMKASLKRYDIVRIDHFRGFDEYYAVPFGDRNAKNGCWEKGPSMDLFYHLSKELGKQKIIAEDLGFLTDTVKELLKESGYPGMKVLQFAFDSREESDYLPHNYERNCVVYTGTHDNNTIQGWYDEMRKEDQAFAKQYMRNHPENREELHWDFILLAMRSVANTCIIPVQDYLGIGREGRINTPSTLGNNWKWRMDPTMLSKKLQKEMRNVAKITGR